MWNCEGLWNHDETTVVLLVATIVLPQWWKLDACRLAAAPVAHAVPKLVRVVVVVVILDILFVFLIVA